MLPWGHLASGYLVYTAFAHVVYRRSPREGPAIALAFGTQFPDLVDKPLAWTFAILPHGRSFGHSLFTAVSVIAVLGLLLGRSRLRTTVAFGIGYLIHLLGDTIEPLLAGEYGALRFLAWPVVPAVEYTTRPTITGHLRDIEFTPFVLLQIAVFGFVAAVWMYDRAPGLRTVIRSPLFVYRLLQSDG